MFHKDYLQKEIPKHYAWPLEIRILYPHGLKTELTWRICYWKRELVLSRAEKTVEFLEFYFVLEEGKRFLRTLSSKTFFLSGMTFSHTVNAMQSFYAWVNFYMIVIGSNYSDSEDMGRLFFRNLLIIPKHSGSTRCPFQYKHTHELT